MMKSKTLLALVLTTLVFPAYAEKIMVDREEYESLKQAVEHLMTQQKEMMEKAARSEEMANEANELATAAVEAVEDESGGLLQGITIGGYGEVHYNKSRSRRQQPGQG